MNDPLKKHIETNREEFDFKEPPAMMWQNIKSSIPHLIEESQGYAVEKIEPKKYRIKPMYYGIAASILIFIVAYLGFNNNSNETNFVQNSIVKTYRVEKQTEKEQIIDDSLIEDEEIKGKANSEIHSNDNMLIALHTDSPKTEELKNLALINAISLIQDTISTSNRIKGISMLEGEQLSEENLLVLRGLSLKDSNSVVRLNALELYTKNLEKNKITEELTSIFLQQNDAMVQLELIHLIKSLNNGFEDPTLIKKLQEIILDSKSSSFVKDEAYVVLLEKNKY